MHPVQSRTSRTPPRTPHANPTSPRASHHHTHQRNESSSARHSFEDVDIADSIVRPPPSALTSRSATAYDPNAPSPLQDFPNAARSSHPRTLSSLIDNCQPFLDRATTTIQQHTAAAAFRPPSPTKSLASFISSRRATDSNASQPKVRALQNWFSGSSAPVTLALAPRSEYSASESESKSESGSESGHDYDSEDESDDDEEEEGSGSMMASLFNRGTSLTGPRNESSLRSPEPSPTRAQHPTAGRKFAWLLSTQKNASMPCPVVSPVYHDADDELLSLDFAKALFPHGPPDPLAPSSFNDLLSNAEALLTRFQNSYRQLSTALVDARSEQSAQEDELDEADTRVRHLKMQLETMAVRAAEQDEQIRKMNEDLDFERRARQEEEAARIRCVAFIRNQPICDHAACADATPRRPHRISGSEISVDSGFESECETDVASVFSRNCFSPTGTDMSSVLEQDLESTPKNRKSARLEFTSTDDKVRHGTVVDLDKGSWGCANCEGGAQAAVWGRLAKEREENRTLRHRVDQLEDAVERALNVVDGPFGM
ncbi:hypothetical protein ACEQ8H_003004 [Pleosporales sp. CAS-2024a]